jgi:hypothetical protein
VWEEWRRVRGKGGAAGVDQTRLRSIGEQAVGQSFEGIQADLKAGEYRTSPVKRQYIPKADGRQRPLRGGQDVKQVIAKLNPVLWRLGKLFSEGDVLTGVTQDGPLRLRAAGAMVVATRRSAKDAAGSLDNRAVLGYGSA